MLFVISNLSIAKPVEPLTLQVFYDELSPYGKWISDPAYGYVWIPQAEAGFRPYYSNGYWVMTEFGNTWVSSYPWGWAAFHYGRWINDGFYGWVWVPGNEWGPAWVVWRSSGDNYGWVPLLPGYSLDASFGPSYYVPVDWWVFIPHKQLLNTSFRQYILPAKGNAVTLKSTNTVKNTAVNNKITYVTGPTPESVQNVAGQRINIYEVKEAAKPGKMMVAKNELSIYKPEFTTNVTGERPKPLKLSKSVHPIGKAMAINAGKSVTASSASAKPASKKKTGVSSKNKSVKGNSTGK